MSQPPFITPFELTLENELGVEAERFNNDWLFKWYGMTYEGGHTNVDDFRGGRIHYAGIKFGYQQQQVFWSAIDRYLDRKVHDTFKHWDQETSALPNDIRLKSIDGVERTLGGFIAGIVALGKETDRRLRGEGQPERVAMVDDSVSRVQTLAEISNLATAHRMLLQRPTEDKRVPRWKWLEDLYTNNQASIWLVGGLISVGGLIVSSLLH